MMYRWAERARIRIGKGRLWLAAKMRTIRLEKVIRSYNSKPVLVQTCKPTTPRCLAGCPTAQCTPYTTFIYVPRSDRTPTHSASTRRARCQAETDNKALEAELRTAAAYAAGL